MYISARTAKSIIGDLKKGIDCQIGIVDWDGVCLGSTKENLKDRSEKMVREYIETGDKEKAEVKYKAYLHTVYVHTQFLCYLAVFSKEQKGLLSYIETIIHWKCQLNEKENEEDHIFEYLYVRLDGRIREGLFREWNRLFDQRSILKETCLALSRNNSSLLLAAKDLEIHQNTMIQRNRKCEFCAGSL